IVRFGSNKICYRFSLCQVKPSVEESAFGELTRFGEARALFQQDLYNLTNDHRRPVTRNFNGILFCKRIRLAEDGYEHLVNDTRVVCQCAKVYGMRWLTFQVFPIKHRLHNPY